MSRGSQATMIPSILVEVGRFEKRARYGVNMTDVQEMIATAALTTSRAFSTKSAVTLMRWDNLPKTGFANGDNLRVGERFWWMPGELNIGVNYR